MRSLAQRSSLCRDPFLNILKQLYVLSHVNTNLYRYFLKQIIDKNLENTNFLFRWLCILPTIIYVNPKTTIFIYIYHM